MKRLLAAATLVMFFCLSVAGGQTATPQPLAAKLLCVFEGRCIGEDCHQEVVDVFVHEYLKQDGTFALCVRSDRPLALALANGNLALDRFPFLISGIYKSPNPVIFLRRKTGEPVVSLPEAKSFPRTFFFTEPSDSGEITELWFVPKGAALPPHSEAVASDHFHLEEIGEKQPVSKRLRIMTDILQRRPGAFGVVWRYYNDEKKPSVKKLQLQTRHDLVRAGLTSDRVLVSSRQVGFPSYRTVIAIAEVLPENPEKK